jgi:uncharacterized protein
MSSQTNAKDIVMDTHHPLTLGSPCWVDTMQPDPKAAERFYGRLLGWTFGDPPGAARLDGRLVTGIRSGGPAVWSMHVGVDDIDSALKRVTVAGGSAVGRPTEDMAVVADPTGVLFCLSTGRAAEVTGEPGTWAMASLHTPDLDRAEAFYEKAFRWELERGDAVGQWRLDGRLVAVVTADGNAPPHWAIAFAVADVDAVAEHAQALGATVLMEPVDTPGFRSAVIADPQGAAIAVSAPR